MDERFKSPPWKGGTEVTLSRVRISLSPPNVSFLTHHKVSIPLVNKTHSAILLHQIASVHILTYLFFEGKLRHPKTLTIKTLKRWDMPKLAATLTDIAFRCHIKDSIIGYEQVN